MPPLATLFARYPDLSIEVVTGSQTVNLHRRDADLTVRMVKPDGGNVTIKRLGALGFGLYGAPAYMAVRPAGADSGRFDDDAFIGWSETYNHLPAAKWIDRILRGGLPFLPPPGTPQPFEMAGRNGAETNEMFDGFPVIKFSLPEKPASSPSSDGAPCRKNPEKTERRERLNKTKT